ncbi:16168_t:CDS:2 [Acaulospora morrowiae]|uniref:16168_t:CDS:1 n=1 Tax=Acaulospora morrowiae TaxID=94023 RepID=A0A9N9CGQ4_9GLOM|nr:16168_t:CDS:2 [Acaulospora morrowiae]
MSYFANNTLASASTGWRVLLNADDRKVNVGRLFKGLELLNQASMDPNQRFELSKQWENDAFSVANTREEYNARIGAKLKEITNMIRNTPQQTTQQQNVQQQHQVSQQPQLSQQQQQVLQQQQQQQQRLLQHRIAAAHNPALQQKFQQEQIRKLQLQRQHQQSQLSQASQQIAVAQAGSFIRPNTPNAQQIQSSPKSAQPNTFRANPNVNPSVLSLLGLPPDTQLTDDVIKKIAFLNQNLRARQAQQSSLQQQDMTLSSPAMSAESQLNRITVNQQAATNNKLSPSQIIQSPINTMKSQVPPPQNPGPSVLIMPSMTNQSPVNLPNKLNQTQTKVPTHIKVPQNKPLTSPAANVNPALKATTSVAIGTSPIPSVQPTNVRAQVGRPLVVPNNVTAGMLLANGVGINPGMGSSNNAAILNQNALLLNSTRPGGLVIPPNIGFRPSISVPVVRNDVTVGIGASSSSTSGQYATLSAKEEFEALGMIKEIDRKSQERRIQYHEIPDLEDDEKSKIIEKLRELEPMYKNVDKLLPYFWHYTKSSQGTSRLLGMKYMIEDQLKALPGKFLLRLETVDNLIQQFRKYFDYVESRRRGIEPTTMINLNATVRPQPSIIPPNAGNLLKPRINSSDLKLPSQRIHHNDPNSMTAGKKRRQSSTEQETQQLSKKQTTNNNNVQSKSTPDVMIIDPPNTALPKTSALSSDNRKSPVIVISDDKPTMGREEPQGNAFHKFDATSEEIRKSAKRMINAVRKCMPYLSDGVIGGLPSEENEQNILRSLANTA